MDIKSCMYALFLLWDPVYAEQWNTHVYDEFSFGGYVCYIFCPVCIVKW